MALILNIETSTKNCSVALAKDGVCLVLCEESKENYQHAEKLHLFIEWAMEGSGYILADLDAICVGKGPGSYTGLRIGVSAAKGLCYALEKPLLAINSLEIMAQHDFSTDYIIPMTDARRMEVYTAVFDREKKMIEATYAKILDPDSFSELGRQSVTFVGDGAAKAKEILKYENANFYTEILPSAEQMCALAEQKFKAKDYEDVAYFEPFYLKDFYRG